MSGYRDNWESWMTRIPKEDSEYLIEWGEFFRKKGLIPKVDKYNISRFALNLLKKHIQIHFENVKSNAVKE